MIDKPYFSSLKRQNAYNYYERRLFPSCLIVNIHRAYYELFLLIF